MQKRIKAHWIFFKSTLLIGIGAALGMCMLRTALPPGPLGPSASQETNIILSLISLFFLFLPAGIILDILYKEIARKQEYYFYYNLSITRIELWIGTLLLSYIPFLLIRVIFYLWTKV